MRCCVFNCVKCTDLVDLDCLPPIILSQFVNAVPDEIDHIVKWLFELNSDDLTLQVDHNQSDHLFQYIILTLVCALQISICNLGNYHKDFIQIGHKVISVKLNNLKFVGDTESFVILLKLKILMCLETPPGRLSLPWWCSQPAQTGLPWNY